MRVSVNTTDPGFINDAWRYRVKLDGSFADYCVTADEEEGYVICYVKDEEGNFKIDPENYTCLQMQIKFGEVQIVKIEESNNGM